MARSTAQQLEFTGLDNPPANIREVSRGSATEPAGTSTVEFRIPEFDGQRRLYASATKRAGRINANSISESEEDALLAERQTLLDKVFNESITRPETCRLEYVGWQLDRIEDARGGITLDMLEDAVNAYERLAADIQSFRDQLAELARTRQ
jgi:hypothetical protein